MNAAMTDWYQSAGTEFSNMTGADLKFTQIRFRMEAALATTASPWAGQSATSAFWRSRIHFISALHGSGVGDLYQSVEEAHDCAFTKWSTNKLTTLLEDAILDHQPPLVNLQKLRKK